MDKSKNILKYVVLVTLAIALGFGAYSGYNHFSGPKTSDDASQVVNEEEDIEYITYTGVNGEDALTTLKGINNSVVTKTSDFGEYVESINGLVGGTDDKYWSFFVDEKLSDVGAGSYIANGEEKIEWKFVNLQ